MAVVPSFAAAAADAFAVVAASLEQCLPPAATDLVEAVAASLPLSFVDGLVAAAGMDCRLVVGAGVVPDVDRPSFDPSAAAAFVFAVAASPALAFALSVVVVGLVVDLVVVGPFAFELAVGFGSFAVGLVESFVAVAAAVVVFVIVFCSFPATL